MKNNFHTARFHHQAFGTSLVTAIVVCLSGTAMAQTENLWTGTASSSWNNDANWSIGIVPTKTGNHHAVINTTPPNIATITVGILPPVDIIIGSGGGSNGRVDHTGGDASTGTNNWMFVGRDGGTGVFNLANTAGTSGTFTHLGTGNGTMTVNAARLYIGGAWGSGSTGTVNVNTNGSLQVGDQLQVGTSSSVGILNFDNGTITTNGFTEFGNGGNCTGTLNMSGGTLNKQGGDHMIIASNGADGFANISGGTINVNREFWVGQAGGSEGILNMSGGTLDIDSWTSVGREGGKGTINLSGTAQILTGPDGEAFIVADNTNSEGHVMQTGGTLTIDNQFWVGSGGGTNNGHYTLTGGDLNVNNWVAIGRGGSAEFNMSGGTFTKTGDGTSFIVASGGTGTFSQTGGVVQVLAGETWMGENGSGSFTLGGESAEFFANYFQVARNGSSTFTVNLNDGTLHVNQIAGGGGNATVNFNGTRIIARASQASFIDGLDTANIGPGGLLLDGASYNLTVPQLLSGAGGLVKDGYGTLILTAANSYAGNTTVNLGGLSITTASTASGALTLANSTTLGITQSALNQATTVSSATFDGDVILDLNLGNFTCNTTTAPLNVSGMMNINGNVTVNIADSLPVVGNIPLVSYASETVNGGFTLGTLPDGVDATLSDNNSGLVSLSITRVNDPYWTGASSNIWNKNPGGTANWMDDYAESATSFADGDPALFDDRVAAGPTNVVLNSTVAPGDSGVTFNNSAVNYTLSGTGKINGNTRLTKSGTGTTTISTANDYTGVTTLAGGTLIATTLANGGIASSIGAADSIEENLIFNGGTLYYTGASTTIDRSFVTTAAGGGIGTDNNLTISGSAFSQNGNFRKSGPGNLTLTHDGNNIFGGGALDGINVLAGTLTLDGTGGFQTNNVTGDIWVGTTLNSGANFMLVDTVLNSSGNYLAIARGSGTTGLTSACTLTNSTLTTGNLSLAYDNGVSGYTATALLTLNDSTYTMTGINSLGESGGGTGTVVLNGASSMTSGPTNIGQNSGATGTLNIKGTSHYTSNNRLHVGSNGGSTGNLIIEESGSMVVNSFISVGFNGGGSMTVRDNGTFSNNDDFSINESGDVPATVTLEDNGSITAAGTVFVGRFTGRVGTLTQTGGTFTGNGNEFQIGRDGQGNWLQSGGITNAGGWVSLGRFGSGTGLVTVSGTGTFNQTGTDRGLMIGEDGIGTLNIQGTATVSSVGSVGVLVSNAASATGTVNLDGGTLAAVVVRDGGGNSTFRFNGGVLKANPGAHLNFMFGLDTVDVKSGGATIDSNGQSIAINQNLLDGTGGGGLTKTGAGFLQLNGTNTYTGTTSVNVGSLGGTGSIAGPLNVTGTGTLAPGASVGTFTSGAANIAGTYAVEINGATSDLLAVNGNLNLNGAHIVVSASAPVGTEWTIATYSGSLSGTVANVTAGYTLNTNTAGVVKLVSTGGNPYTTWAAANITAIDAGADASAGGDPDHDGEKNIAEFALNGNPLSGASSGKVVGKIANISGTSALVLTLPVRSGVMFSGATEKISNLTDGVIYTIQGSDQLAIWNLVVSEVLGADKTTIESGMPALDGGWEYRTFRSPGTVAGDAQDFLRAVITQP